MGANPLPSGTAFVVLSGVFLILLWKKKGARLRPWLALLAGLSGSYIVMGWLGSLATMTVYGVGVVGLTVIFGALIFWHEAVKGNGSHHVRTPLVGFALGVALMAGSGGVQHAAQHLNTQVTSVITHGTSTVSGGR